jgi:hypothetical protein
LKILAPGYGKHSFIESFTSPDGIKNPEGFLGHQKSFALLIGHVPLLRKNI